MRRFDIQPLTTGRRFESPLLTEFALARPSGTLESPPIEPAEPFERAVLSWNGAGNWRMELRLRAGNQWTPYALMGVQKGLSLRSATRAEEEPLKRSPIPCSLEIDTLVLKKGIRADAFQVRVTGDGAMDALAVTHYRPDNRQYTERPAADAWGVTLPVPERAQRECEDPAIRAEVCSPTSLSMVLAYYKKDLRTIDTCRLCRDTQSKIYGNWPCNTAVAARIVGGWAAVVKMRGWDDVEREIAAKRPVIVSHQWERGDLSNAPISRSDGHLIVAVGFTPDGDVVVNDPAAKRGEVRRIYKRAELYRTWQERGAGIVYLVHPEVGIGQ